MTENPDDWWTSNAFENGDTEAIRRRVLDDPAYLTSRDSVGNTPLLNAVVYNDIDMVRFLIEHGADPDPVVDDGYTPLLWAVESEDPASISMITLLIEAGADIHRMGVNGWAPLHMAAARGYGEKTRLLLAAGARIDQRIEIDDSETPLMEAAWQGRAETVRILLEHGADPTLRTLLRDTLEMDRTPLEIAFYAVGRDRESPNDRVLNSDFDEVIRLLTEAMGAR